MKHYTKLKESQGNEISLFPLEVANISRDQHPSLVCFHPDTFTPFS